MIGTVREIKPGTSGNVYIIAYDDEQKENDSIFRACISVSQVSDDFVERSLVYFELDEVESAKISDQYVNVASMARLAIETENLERE